ncbi:MAG: prepilin-type N-terminal cleavage/methylation domain-containing protein [Planctomycetota bacterium]|jgi:prepilin-type N-terminal cleavage/methylation domain-containing protein
MRQHGQTAGHGRRHGFTLIELVVTVAVMSVIMLGVGSAMIIGMPFPSSTVTPPRSNSPSRTATAMTYRRPSATNGPVRRVTR